MANQDRYAGTTVNQAQVVNNLNLVFNLRQNYDKFEYVPFGYIRLDEMLIFI